MLDQENLDEIVRVSIQNLRIVPPMRIEDWPEETGYTFRDFTMYVLSGVHREEDVAESEIDSEFREQVKTAVNRWLLGASDDIPDGLEFNPQFDDLKDETI